MSSMFNSRLLGGVLLIVGTSIGGALLVLPVTNAPAGFAYSTLTMVAIWALTAFAGLLMLEINLWLPANSNLISMADKTLGKPGKLIAWITYLLLLYALLSAYISGGADVVRGLTSRIGFTLPEWINALVFTFLFGFIVYRGIKLIDHVNRGLMFCKLGAFILLVAFIIPHDQIKLLSGGEAKYIVGAVIYIITSFGFAIIIPSLRSYFQDNVAQLRFVITIGTFVPLLCYILWNYTIMGVIARSGDHSLMSMLANQYGPIDLVTSLGQTLQKHSITNMAQFFISICILTAFLGVSLSMVDFLADGLNKQKTGKDGWLVYSLAFVPPIIIAIFAPNVFVAAFRYAGIICVVLLILLPITMAWSGRYFKKVSSGYQVAGGKISLTMATLLALILFVVAVQQTFWPSF